MNLVRQAAWVGVPAKEWTKCARKRLITDPEEARHRAVQMQIKYEEIFNWYQCAYCGGYHVGRISPSKGKRFIQNRVNNVRNAIRFLTPYIMEKWTKVL